ncbi:hypothetical protein [Sphingopyxis fribergensis]
MTRTIWAAVAAVALLGSGQAAAFQQPADTAADASSADAAPAAKKLPDGTTPEERANTARLNAAQSTQAQAETTTYEQEVSAAKQQVEHDQTVFAEETAAYEAEKARVAAMSAEERLKWEADAAACKAGDTTRCAAPVTPPR